VKQYDFNSLCICDETAHLYMGENLIVTHALPDETEFLERRLFPFETALRMSLEGNIMDSMSVLGLVLAARRLGK
jgi:hypothetical protein